MPRRAGGQIPRHHEGRWTRRCLLFSPQRALKIRTAGLHICASPDTGCLLGAGVTQTRGAHAAPWESSWGGGKDVCFVLSPSAQFVCFTQRIAPSQQCRHTHTGQGRREARISPSQMMKPRPPAGMWECLDLVPGVSESRAGLP